MIKLKILFLLIFIEITLAHGQSFYAIKRNRDLILNVSLGTTNYFGDFVNSKKLGFIRPALAIGAEHFISNRIAARVECTWFQIAGSDKKANDDRDERNLSFTSTNVELSALGVVNLSPVGIHFYQRSSLNFYGFAGIALLYMNPKTEYQGKKYALQPLQTEGIKYSRFQPVIPMGFGIKVKYGPFFNILFEGGYRVTFTDYLDDVNSTRYPDPTTLKSDLSVALSDRRAEIGTKPADYKKGKRGNPAKNDSYFMMNVKIQYYLPYQLLENGSRKLYNRKRKAIYKRHRG